MEVTGAGDASSSGMEVERLAEEFLDRLRRGERPTIEEYAAAHSDLADEIRTLFPTLLMVEDLGAGSTDRGSAASPSASIQELGEYRILRELGRGGMGIVYEAEQSSLGRRVALKILPHHSLLDSKQIGRFQQEARAAARLTHSNIVPVYGVGEHLGIHYYVMQFIPGHGLDKVIEEVRHFREERSRDPGASSSRLAAALESGAKRVGRDAYFHNVAAMARDAALALDYAHGEGVLHRDVKPSNLLIDPNARVWLTDFGLAKAEGGDNLTLSGDLVGTLRYMAPERFKGWADPRSDVYGLGITLYELLTLKPAFSELDRVRLLRRVTSEEPLAPRRVDRSIPRDLETIVLKAIAKEPSLRYSSARALAGDLDCFLEGKSIVARRSTMVGRCRRWVARNPLIATLAAAVLLLLIAVASVASLDAVKLAYERDLGREELRAAYLASASTKRTSGHPDRRFESLDALRKAAEIRSGPDLVDEAIACLAQPGARPLRSWDSSGDAQIAVAPDLSIVARSSPDGEIRIHSWKDGEELFRLPKPTRGSAHTFMKMCADGKHLAARYSEQPGSVWRIWDLSRRITTATFDDASLMNCFDFSADGRWAAMGTSRNAVRLIDLTTGATIKEIVTYACPRAVAIHPGGRLIALSIDDQARLTVIDRESGQMIRSLRTPEKMEFDELAWHPDGRTIAAANHDYHVYLWNAESDGDVRVFKGHDSIAIGVSFADQGHLLVSYGWDAKVRLWDLGLDQPIFTLRGNYGNVCGADSQRCWTSCKDLTEVWELTPARHAFTLFGHEGRTDRHPRSIALSPDGRFAITTGADGARLWDLFSRAELARVTSTSAEWALFDGSGRSLFTSGVEGVQRWPIRRLDSGSIRIVVGPPQQLSPLRDTGRIAIGGGGRQVAFIHDAKHAHVLDLEDPARSRILISRGNGATTALSPRGDLAAIAGWSGDHVDIVRLEDGEPIRSILADHPEVRFDPRGEHLAICTPKEYSLLDVRDWGTVWRIERERGSTFSGFIAFDNSGKIAAITHNDSKIWLIEATSGTKLVEMEAVEPMLLSSIDLAGGTLVAATQNQRFHVWDLNGIAKDLSGVGLEWKVPLGTTKPAEREPVHVAVAEGSLDPLLEEIGDLGPLEFFRPAVRSAFLTEIASYNDLDHVLNQPVILISRGPGWRFFRGRTEPSTALEWTDVEFDDQNWERGASTFNSWRIADGRDGTVLANQPSNYSTVYFRREFDASAAVDFARVVAAVEMEDGIVVYLNGREIGRSNVGRPGERLGHDAFAVRVERARTTEVFEIAPDLIRPGKNVLAVQVLASRPASGIHMLAYLAAVPSPETVRDRQRTENVIRRPDGAVDAALDAYREGRILQRARKFTEAIAEFDRASSADPASAEPVLRRLACNRSLGELELAQRGARDAIERGGLIEDARLWRAWFRMALVDVHLAPASALAVCPQPRPSLSPAGADHRWVLEQLAAHRTIRIHCGGDELTAEGGMVWSQDRFYRGGWAVDRKLRPRCERSASPTVGGELCSTARVFDAHETFHAGYQVPLPPGRYAVSLHFDPAAEPAADEVTFDVLLEGKVALESYAARRDGSEPHDIRRLESDVTDGALEVDFLVHDKAPALSGIEIEEIPPAR